MGDFMKKNSIWFNKVDKKNIKQLNKDLDVDVLIIGGGITGISTAYHLKESNLKICLVDQDIIGHGVSGKTTGKLTFLQELIYSKLTDEYSIEIANKYLKSQKDAIKIVEDIINKNNINCDYNRVDSYIFADSIKDMDKIKKEKEILEKIGVSVTELNDLPISLKCYCAIKVGDTAVFHPVKYLYSLKKILIDKGIEIYERTKIIEIKKEKEKYVCFTENNKISAKKVVLACHYPFFIFPFVFPLKGYLERSYVSASKISDYKDISIINVGNNTKSVRYHNDGFNSYFIYLNGSHNLDGKYNVKENFNTLFKDLNNLNLVADYIWTNHDIITNDHLPYIGYLEDNLIIGTGYNTWGMTNGSLAGKIISDLILERENEYINLFDPKRNKPMFNILSIIHDIYSSAKPFVENKLIKNKDFYSENITFETRNGKAVAIYKDDDNKEHIVYNKCPHLKCSLIFNEIEKTWDCSCHGSRFNIDGKCVQGPSNYDISYKEE